MRGTQSKASDDCRGRALQRVANSPPGAGHRRLQAADETPQCHRRHAERARPAAWVAARALSRFGQSKTAKLFYWSGVQCEAVASARGMEAAASGFGRCRSTCERGSELKLE